jgi:DNA-directed RNA polymerase subunit RPC12/RpoP
MAEKKQLFKRFKEIPASVIIVGLLSGLIGGVFLLSCILGLTTTYGLEYLQNTMFYMILGMGIILSALSYLLLSGKYKLSTRELRERGKREPDLVCINCGRSPSLGIDDDGGRKALYGNRCPYCGHRMF